MGGRGKHAKTVGADSQLHSSENKRGNENIKGQPSEYANALNRDPADYETNSDGNPDLQHKHYNGSSGEGDEDENHDIDDDAPTIPPNNRGVFLNFIRSLATTKGDLISITSPPFLLSGLSMLEYVVGWMNHPKVFFSISQSTTPLGRMVEIVRWLTASAWDAFGNRKSPTGHSEKKPYNPILGEQFHCSWHCPDLVGDCNQISLVCEQVSHHPPVSAFFFNSSAIRLHGHTTQSLQYKGTHVRVAQKGRTQLELLHHNEIYTFKPPTLNMRGLLSGKFFCELSGQIVITSLHTDYEAIIEYIPKSWFSGKYHDFKASIHLKGDKAHPIYTINGNWHNSSTITNFKTGETEPFYSVADAAEGIEPLVKPLEQQAPIESRRVWQHVTEALVRSDWGTASYEKDVVEERQRMLSRSLKEENIEWEPLYFKKESEKLWVPICGK